MNVTVIIERGPGSPPDMQYEVSALPRIGELVIVHGAAAARVTDVRHDMVKDDVTIYVS